MQDQEFRHQHHPTSSIKAACAGAPRAHLTKETRGASVCGESVEILSSGPGESTAGDLPVAGSGEDSRTVC